MASSTSGRTWPVTCATGCLLTHVSAPEHGLTSNPWHTETAAIRRANSMPMYKLFEDDDEDELPRVGRFPFSPPRYPITPNTPTIFDGRS